ncbi:MAG: hypothetical protein H6673_13475 [Anaerolineales bacterium]|nr:hypothetical protein [Anaerolineales bacterium]
MQTPAGLLFVFSGPAGAGKNTIMNLVKESETTLRQLPTATTRPRRSTEQEGREHEFLTEAEFRQRILEKGLVEWQIIHDKAVYGVPRQTVRRLVLEDQLALADVDVLGAMDLKHEFGDHVVLIFVQAPDQATLERRLRARDDIQSEEELYTRLRRADFEMGFASQYDYRLINRDDHLEDCATEAIEIIQREVAMRGPSEPNPGWDPQHIRYWSTGLLIQDGQVLVENDTLPRVAVPADKLPFEAIQDALYSALTINIQPTRRHAEKRQVDVGFEPPQLATVSQTNGDIHRTHFYVLKAEEIPTSLPIGWAWVPIESLPLDDTLSQLLLQSIGDLQLD